MKLDHWQGRDPAKQSADEDTFAEFMLRFACVIAFAAVLASVPAWGQTLESNNRQPGPNYFWAC